MSIVEKALAKAQNNGTRPAAPAGVHGVAPPARPGAVQLRDAAPAAPAQAAPPITGPSITIDREHLRREGVLPPADFERRIIDEYRRIKWPVLDVAFGRSRAPAPGGNVIVVTSAMPGEGKTFSAVNLAMALALERDCTVLLVDADLARPRVTSVLGLQHSPGLTDVLSEEGSDWRSIALNTDIPGLSVLPAGRRSSQGPELLGSKRMEALLAQWSSPDRGQVVLIDSAPLLATNEAQVLARLAGQILMVVRANSTPQPAVAEALALLDRSKPIGLVLNDASSVFGDYSYYGYYDEPNKNQNPG